MKRSVFSCFLLLFVLSVFVGCDVDQNMSVDSSQTSRELHYGYGVLKGNLVSHELEDVVNEGRWTHYMLFVRAGGFTYRCAINLFNRQGKVLYRSIPFSTMSHSGGIFNLSDGFHYLGRDSASGALDFIRHPGILELIKDNPWKTDNLIYNNTQVPVVASLLSNVRKVYVFGEPFHDGTKGVHDIHQNQGNMPGETYAHLNGLWQDGAVIVEYPPKLILRDAWTWENGKLVKAKKFLLIPRRRIFMTRFVVQRDLTDQNGDGVNGCGDMKRYAGFGKTVTRHYGPYNSSQFEILLTSSFGSQEIFVKRGSAPTTTRYDYKAKTFLKLPGQGNYYVMVRSTSKTINPFMKAYHKWEILFRGK